MNSGIDELLDHVDQWKLKLHQKLKRMTPTQRKAFWKQFHDEARRQGLRNVDLDKRRKRVLKRPPSNWQATKR